MEEFIMKKALAVSGVAVVIIAAVVYIFIKKLRDEFEYIMEVLELDFGE